MMIKLKLNHYVCFVSHRKFIAQNAQSLKIFLIHMITNLGVPSVFMRNQRWDCHKLMILPVLGEREELVLLSSFSSITFV